MLVLEREKVDNVLFCCALFLLIAAIAVLVLEIFVLNVVCVWLICKLNWKLNLQDLARFLGL